MRKKFFTGIHFIFPYWITRNWLCGKGNPVPVISYVLGRIDRLFHSEKCGVVLSFEDTIILKC